MRQPRATPWESGPKDFISPERAKLMPQSLAQILVHLVFSTKNREALLADDIRDELHAYIGGIVENQKGTLLKAGSVADHIHLLIAHPRTCAPSELVQEIKTGSSKWLKTKASRYADFHWQSGYGIFSISPTHRPALEQYIANQAEHHRKVTFQQEYRRLLEKYGIQFDERYVWD
jgi:REP element-mobilizing transposase RayT